MKKLILIGVLILVAGVIWNLPNYRQNSYFVSYYTTTGTNGFFGQRIFVSKTLDVSTINRMKGLLDEENTNSTSVIISISKLP